jgi:Restriction alleviation protein Lar
MNNETLRPCPACGKAAGELRETKAARFPFRVQCRACGWSTDAVKLEAVAVKLWNEAKREGQSAAEMKSLAEAGLASPT